MIQGDNDVVCQITAMPTFIYIKNKSKVADLTGANVEKLKELVASHKWRHQTSGHAPTLDTRVQFTFYSNVIFSISTWKKHLI